MVQHLQIKHFRHRIIILTIFVDNDKMKAGTRMIWSCIRKSFEIWAKEGDAQVFTWAWKNNLEGNVLKHRVDGSLYGV
jgi:hypothetical protein